MKKRLLVIGSGPAGLSAAVHALEASGGELEVELVSMGHHLGGKAKSWRDAENFVVDHGFHAVFGFYDELRSLARRAGVDLSTALVSSKGRTRAWSQAHHELHETSLSRNGLVQLNRFLNMPWLSWLERKQLTTALARMAQTVARVGAEALDDVCYRAFLLEHGAPPAFVRHPLSRQANELLFNEPFDISTYIVVKGAELIGHCYDDAVFHYIAGGISELFWNPIADYFQRLGGSLRVREKLVHLGHTNGRVTECHFATPDNEGFHQFGTREWPNDVPTLPRAPRVDRPDAVICTLPPACFTHLNPADETFWSIPEFANVKNLRMVPTVSVQLWLEQPAPRTLDSTVSGLPLPLGYAVDLKQIVPEFRKDGRYGAMVEWVGTEAGFEAMTDDELVQSALAGVAQLPQCERLTQARIVHRAVRRNRADHSRYLLTEPGTLRFRPRARTTIANLFLAGDWVRNEIDIPTMEGAIRSGKEAARAALATL